MVVARKDFEVEFESLTLKLEALRAEKDAALKAVIAEVEATFAEREVFLKDLLERVSIVVEEAVEAVETAETTEVEETAETVLEGEARIGEDAFGNIKMFGPRTMN